LCFLHSLWSITLNAETNGDEAAYGLAEAVAGVSLSVLLDEFEEAVGAFEAHGFGLLRFTVGCWGGSPGFFQGRYLGPPLRQG